MYINTNVRQGNGVAAMLPKTSSFNIPLIRSRNEYSHSTTNKISFCVSYLDIPLNGIRTGIFYVKRTTITRSI